MDEVEVRTKKMALNKKKEKGRKFWRRYSREWRGISEERARPAVPTAEQQGDESWLPRGKENDSVKRSVQEHDGKARLKVEREDTVSSTMHARENAPTDMPALVACERGLA
ncbi:hypothetical protein HPB48_014864 [Haemaphysalis longicornis]|uniref:Uncharacterized protein n=1 Tax=Haemaphysalis longicornis TaxID=44386 RepID=A0A9J6GEC7_HAELO|nr:hypothetical protein HPB48_014864 [Haemaphysalis longicornis]